MKVFLYPNPDGIEANHGIGRIVHAQYQYLPDYGIEFVSGPENSDLIVTHTQMFDLLSVDVVHLHGMYWTGDPGSGVYERWHWKANEKIIKAVRQAFVTTVPAPWVQEPFLRDMRRVPRVIGHGIDFDQWEPGESKGYVLWNKNRNRDVCDPTPAWELAEHGIRVVSTFAPIGKTPNEYMTVTGSMGHDQMKELIRHALIYLATVKETYGIGTLEALACGVPVLGYNYGGTAGIVKHKETGYLARPGDFQDLMLGYDYITQNWSSLSEAAREYARSRDWRHVIGEYAQVYQEAALVRGQEKTSVSIVITNYNYAQYVGEAIQSALGQTIPCEVIVVDDGSTDNSRQRINEAQDHRGQIRVIEQPNRGVAAARNAGVGAATGGFVICLDADDRLDPRYAEVLRDALVADRGLGIGYTGLGLIHPDGEQIAGNPWPPQFSWDGQTIPHIPPSNAIPCAAMFRKKMWERAGGYRQEFAPAEDTEFWVRGLSVGYTARKIENDYLFHYRPHDGSASRTKQYVSIDTWHPWMRDKDYPMGAPVNESVPLIRSYSTPRVSVIVPCAPHHIEFLPRALDSLLGQTMREWEVIVIGPLSDAPESYRQIYPFVKVVDTGGLSTSEARNLGLGQARAPLCLFLDADDMLMPDALENMMRKYHVSGGRYVYSDWIRLYNGEAKAEHVPDYDPMAMLHVPQHAITVLMATRDALDISFDERLDLLEDWDFFARCAIAGVHGIKADKPAIVVRVHANRKTQRMATVEARDKFVGQVFPKYEAWRTGEKEMGSCCGGNDAAVLAAKYAVGLIPNPSPEQSNSPQSPDVVRMVFISGERGSMNFGGKGITPSGRSYKGGDNPFNKYVDADPRDAEWLERSGYFAKVAKEGTPVTPVDMQAVQQVIERMAQVDEVKVSAPPVDEPVEIPQDGLVVPDRPRSRRAKAKADEDAA